MSLSGWVAVPDTVADCFRCGDLAGETLPPELQHFQQDLLRVVKEYETNRFVHSPSLVALS